ncbi:MAG: glycosyltransferase family 10 [Planctomycetota bacterium]
MPRVAITTSIPLTNPEALCPGSQLRWGDTDFVWNPPEGTETDYWIVWASLDGSARLRVASENTLFLAGEPPAKKVYPRGYYRQFHRLVCTQADYPHPRVTHDALGLNWHVGYDRHTGVYSFGYDHLSSLPAPADQRDGISVICSNLTTTQGQRNRLAFLDALKAHFGDRLTHFGRGFQPIDDKLDGILPYRYHLVLENSISDDYWTEKLADAYLGWAYPIYAGCTNLSRFMPPDSFMGLDGLAVGSAIERIEALLQHGLSPAQDQALAEGRDAVLNRYNPFAWFAHWAEAFGDPSRSRRDVVIRSHKAFRSWGRGRLYRMRSLGKA